MDPCERQTSSRGRDACFDPRPTELRSSCSEASAREALGLAWSVVCHATARASWFVNGTLWAGDRLALGMDVCTPSAESAVSASASVPSPPVQTCCSVACSCAPSSASLPQTSLSASPPPTHAFPRPRQPIAARLWSLPLLAPTPCLRTSSSLYFTVPATCAR